ncbi:DUF1887 family protein [Dolichospermum sp. LEGE 00246]|nr:DUF1887 family protein [Dolichospermum sp. LEGE 00246]
MNTTNPFKDHKVQHLFLLVGENPLPNYVAAMKLLDKNKKCTVYLVHTNKTDSQAEQLTRALKNICKGKGVSLDKEKTQNNKSNAYKIYEEVYKYASAIPVHERIGLHYTGGTNTMAVHAHRAISELNSKRNDTVFSYLDASTLEIFVDTSELEPFHRGVELEVSLEQLFKLHNYEFQQGKQPLSQPILPGAAAEFVRIYQNEEIAKIWRRWSNTHLDRNSGELKNAIDSNTGRWKSEDDLSKLLLNLSSIHPDFIDVLVNHLDASRAMNKLALNETKKKGFKNCQQICQWLGGIWLEHYVLNQIQEITKDEKYSYLNIGESQMNFEMLIKKKTTHDYVKFEFDVAFMRNYQLFAISCTTSKDPKECKLKLFEAYIRAKQLGGDEARVALVCCCDHKDDPSKQNRIDRYLKRQLETATDNPKIAVFVRTDLPDLKTKIATWVKDNKGQS